MLLIKDSFQLHSQLIYKNNLN